MSFFFSSRRRHTRCSRDWSSDVCSSDLEKESKKKNFILFYFVCFFLKKKIISLPVDIQVAKTCHQLSKKLVNKHFQIGRASCREKGKISVVAVSLKKKKKRKKSRIIYYN